MKLKEIEVGEIFLFHSHQIKPPKKKFHLCVAQNQFFLINSKPSYHGGSFEIKKAEYPTFLVRNSHVCCTHIFEYDGEFIVNDKKKADATVNTIKRILAILPNIKTLSPVQKRTIATALNRKLADLTDIVDDK